MTEAILNFIRSLTPKSESVIPVQVERSGAVRVDVESYLASTAGEKQLAEAQTLWERSESRGVNVHSAKP